MDHKFDKKYYEDGVNSKVSAYENYRWMPERSIREATSLINKINFETVLDFGCAKGFLVNALRLLGKSAFGVDLSSYAIDNCHPDVKDFVFNIADKPIPKFQGTDLLLAKDVLEHLTETELDKTLLKIRENFGQIFIAVPLGDGRRYRIREYEMDVTHVIRQTEEWWIKKINNAGFKITYFDYHFGYIKEHWLPVEKFGNCFIVAK
jgi:2-polyprenyl-3-methyl-5-hydroxy-6-metoxy-1,4-benzoquinol methylase